MARLRATSTATGSGPRWSARPLAMLGSVVVGSEVVRFEVVGETDGDEVGSEVAGQTDGDVGPYWSARPTATWRGPWWLVTPTATWWGRSL